MSTVETIIGRQIATRDMLMGDLAHAPSPSSCATEIIAALRAAGYVIEPLADSNRWRSSSEALEAIRLMPPGRVFSVRDLPCDEGRRKTAYNAATYAVRVGAAIRLRYGSYQRV